MVLPVFRALLGQCVDELIFSRRGGTGNLNRPSVGMPGTVQIAVGCSE